MQNGIKRNMAEDAKVDGSFLIDITPADMKRAQREHRDRGAKPKSAVVPNTLQNFPIHRILRMVYRCFGSFA